MIRVPLPDHEALIAPASLNDAARLLGETIAGGRTFLVTDENVAAAGWADRLADAIPPIGRHVIIPGEQSKSFRGLEVLLDNLIEAGMDRGDHVMALGGGVVGDLAGLAAALLKRGCGWIQVPTTLLAQVDAAVGGKTAINSRHGKNLIGAFHRPAAVLIDPDTLATLPVRELRAGYAEVVKYGLIGNEAFFAWCEDHGEALIAGDAGARLRAIETCVRAKAAIVAADERETGGKRMLLNLGHSFAHALEAEAERRGTNLLHGEAVAVGLALAFRLSAELGLCAPHAAERVEAHLRSVGLPTWIAEACPGATAEALLAHMAHDKKARGGQPRLVLARGIGAAFIEERIDPRALESFLARAAQPG
jgi:3-dehydroquinate synthase